MIVHCAGSIALVALAALASAGSAFAQTYPTRPVRILVPFAPGGPTDVIARMLAARFTEVFGQQFVVDNRPGAAGNIAIGMAARAAGDGYTLLVSSSAYVVNPSLFANAPYDPYKDFAPVTNVGASPNLLYVHPSLQARSVKELTALVKSQPGKWSVALPGIGTTPHLSAEMFKLALGLDIVNVPYNGAAPVLQAMLANQNPMAFSAISPVIPHAKAGAVRALAVTTAKRTPALPEVPTLGESGLPGQEADTFQALFAPAATPSAIVNRLNAEAIKLLATPEGRDRVLALGFDIVANSPEAFRDQIRVEVAKYRKVIQDAKIKGD
jgi:tripartite-type tricarboxylate transporter receptor subunit TctC